MSSSPTQVAGSAAPRVTNEEVRSILHTHIRKTAKFIKFLDLCVHLFAWVAVMFGLWLVACVVDHWLVPLSSIGRWLVWILGVTGTAWWVVTKLVPLLVRRINPAYAAKRIEHLLPEFKNGLISWLELDQMPENGVPRGIMSALTYRAARFIGGQDPSTTVDTSRLIKLIGVVLLLFTSLVVYTIVSPKSVLDTGKRIAMPWRSIAAPSRVQILSVKPGAVELTQGKPLEVDVEVRGIRTKEAVRVRFTTTDGQLRDQRIELTAVSEGFRYGGKVRTETTGVEHELDYWVEAGDAVSGPFRVSLSPLPSIVLDQVDLKFPAYTKIPDRKVSGGDFEAIEGTRATIHAIANQKMARGRWEINPEIDAAGELTRADAVHELSVDDRELTGTLLLQLNSEKENPTKLTYRLRGFNQRGDGNREPILHSMQVIADVGPEIKLVGPESRRQKVRPTSRFNLEVQANDPDFGLSQIDIEIRRSGLVVRKETLLKSEGEIGQQIKRLPINMADLKLVEGAKLEVRAFAYDNRHDPISERLTPNVKESELLTLEVVGADQEVAPDEEPPSADEPANGDGKSDQNQDAGSESSRSGSGAGNQSNSQKADDRGANPTDPNAAEPPRASSEQDNNAQEPRQNSTPNPADPNGSRDQGEQPGKQESQAKQEGQQGKQEGGQAKQTDQSKSSDGKQQSGPAGAQQNGAGKQESGQQKANDQGSQSDSSSGSSSKNSKANPSNSGQSGNEPSNSLGSNSSSPSSNAANSNSSEKINAGESEANDNTSSRDEGSKPSDGEVVKRVQEYMQENKPKPNGNESGGNQQANDNAGSDSKESNKLPNEKDATPKQDGTGKEAAKNGGAKGEGTKSETKPNGTGSQEDNNDVPNPLGQPSSQPDTESKSNPTDPSAKENSGNSQPDNQGSQDKKTQDKDSDAKEASDTKGDTKSDGSSTDKKNSNGQDSDGKGADNKSSNGKGSDGKGSDGKGSDGKGSDGKGSDGKGSDGKGSDGKGSDGKGSDGKGSDGKGSDGKGSDGKGSDGKGSDGKGSDGKGSNEKGTDSKSSDGKGSDAKGSDGKGENAQDSDPKGSESKGSESKGSESKGEQGGGAQASKPSGGGEGGGKANGSKTGKSGSSGSGTGNGEGGGEGKADTANADYANRTTQMVLDYLNRQKDQPDPELLRELNWTEDDLRKFTERWSKARDLATSPNPADQKKWREMLEDLGLNRQTIKPSAAGSIDDNFQQMRDSGNRTRPPENLRKQYEAFRRAFEKSGK
jgi:collagen type III alpha